jgi:hypothetical protein
MHKEVVAEAECANCGEPIRLVHDIYQTRDSQGKPLRMEYWTHGDTVGRTLCRPVTEAHPKPDSVRAHEPVVIIGDW